MTKVHEVTLLIVDFDQLGAEEIKNVIENARYPNRCISPQVKNTVTVEVEWDDDHPLNNRHTKDEEYKRLFNK